MKVTLTKKGNNNPEKSDIFPEVAFEAELEGYVGEMIELKYKEKIYSIEVSSILFDKEDLLLEGGVNLPSEFLGRFLFRINEIQ